MARSAAAETVSFPVQYGGCGTLAGNGWSAWYAAYNWAEASSCDGQPMSSRNCFGRGYFSFPTGAIPDHATIHSVSMSYVGISAGGGANPKLFKVSYTPNLWTEDWSMPWDMTEVLADLPFPFYYWYTVSLPTWVVEKTQDTQLATQLPDWVSSDSHIRISCWEYVPYLTVTYTAQVCGNNAVEGTEQCDGGACCSPSCTFKASTNVCRAAAGDCDLAESCTGASAGCPADARKATTTVCRSATGTCDVAETCGGGVSCPPDTLKPASSVCRPSAGSCDVAELCSGSSPACPADALEPSGKVCGPTGSCGNGWCNGTSSTCPPPYKPAGTTCRSSAGVCDVTETCTGSSGDCPGNVFVASGTVCRGAAGVCDKADACTGSSASCPADAKVAAGTVCRAPAGGCDVAETCNGSGNACPADALAGAGTTCRAAAGTCDHAEVCSGSATACPADVRVAAGTLCRGSAGECDTPESCTGAAACPADGFLSGNLCRGSTGPCDLAESCSGGAAACPADGFQYGNLCRGSTGQCDLAEHCSGGAPSCPVDAFAEGSVCRPSVGWWDSPEACGALAECPPDGEPLTPPSGLPYVGCFTDADDRALPVFMGAIDHPIPCLMAARDQGYRYAGLQNGNQCWAGDQLGYQEVPDDECSMPCNKSAYLCGGPWRNSVYDTRLDFTYATAKLTLVSRDRWLIHGRDGGHCEAACLETDTKFPHCTKWESTCPDCCQGDPNCQEEFQCVEWASGCQDIAHIDGLYLQPWDIRVNGNTPNSLGSPPMMELGYIEGSFQLAAGHWEWPERGLQNGPDPFSYCSGDRVFDHDIHTYRPVDIAVAQYEDVFHLGAPTAHTNSLDIVWHESDMGLPADYYRWTQDFGPWLSQCLSLGPGEHTLATDQAIQNVPYVSPSLCDDRGCGDGHYAVKFDVICEMQTSSEPATRLWIDYWGAALFGGLAYHRYGCLSDGHQILTNQTYDGFSSHSYCHATTAWNSPASAGDVLLAYTRTWSQAELDQAKYVTHSRYGTTDSSVTSPYCSYNVLCDCNSDCWIKEFSKELGDELDVLSPCWGWCGP